MSAGLVVSDVWDDSLEESRWIRVVENNIFVVTLQAEKLLSSI